MLKELWDSTGRVFMAVYCGGAAFAPGHGHVTYDELLTEVRVPVELVIAVSMGNDFYAGKKGARVWNDAMEKAMTEFGQQVSAKAKHAYVVLGASAATWQYERSMTREMQALYDADVRRGRAVFGALGIAVVDGAAELGRLLPVSYTHLTLPTKA